MELVLTGAARLVQVVIGSVLLSLYRAYLHSPDCSQDTTRTESCQNFTKLETKLQLKRHI